MYIRTAVLTCCFFYFSLSFFFFFFLVIHGSRSLGVFRIVVVLLLYVHGKYLRSCRDGQLT